jgi:uncharacterized protein (TIGR00730 family)
MLEPADSHERARWLADEYLRVEHVLEAHGIGSTVVVFGSARAGFSHANEARGWYDEARKLGRIVSERGGAKNPANGIRHNVIATGGGPGIMEAANRGALEAGAPSIGFNIELPLAQAGNNFTTPELSFTFHYFAIRKMHLVIRAAALVVFPGGYGTLDEMFEILTLIQTGKSRRVPVICVDRVFWQRTVNIDYLTQEGLLEATEANLLRYAENAEEVWQSIEKEICTAG